VRAEELAGLVRSRYPDVVVARAEATVVVDRSDLHDALAFLRDDSMLSLDSLSGVTATDWPGRTPRYWLAYDLYSMVHKHRLRLKVGLLDDDPHVPSVVVMYPTANWHERETFDFYGIVFDGHPDLRRILMPDGWEGHPLRKTEDLGGVTTRDRGAFIPPVDRRTM
jgi:NADH-quinone oxidoreductase subunit C